MKSMLGLAMLALVLLPVALARGGGRGPSAASLTLRLERSNLRNVDDVAGRWQFEGGKVFEGDQQVGYYSSSKRVVTGGTNAQNTAMLTVTVFFLGENPPENITLQGSHDFHSGRQVGSVSAASESRSPLIGRRFSRDGDVLTVE